MSATRTLDAATQEPSLTLLRLHRGAVGRAPTAGGLRALRAAAATGASLASLARGLLDGPEARALHGGADGPVDAAFVARALAAASGGVAGPGGMAMAPSLLRLGTDRAGVLAALASTPLFPDDPPPLPALFADRRPDDDEAYAFWVNTIEPARPAPAASDLSITLAMPVGDSTAEAAGRSVHSLVAQTHAAWRLVLVPGILLSPWSRRLIERLQADARVVLQPRIEDETEVTALDRAMRSGEDGAAALLAPGDRLAPDALALVAAAFAGPATTLVYTDDDRWDPALGRCDPRFKPDAGLEAMLTGNAVGQLAAYRRRVLDELGGLDPAAWPYHAYDLALRATLAAGAVLRHIPHVLHHAAERPADWAVPAAHRRPGVQGVQVAAGAWPRLVPNTAARPLVSVLMPTRNRADLLRVAAEGVLHNTRYAPLELLIVDHGSTEPDAVALLTDLAQDERVRVLPFAGAFNFAAMNNQAAAEARGEVLLLLNNDVEIHQPGWLAEMVGHALRPGVGLVGARLLHRDGTLQHGGIVLGPEGRATHLLRGAAPGDAGYLGALVTTRTVAAVTGACMAIRREVYKQVGGMNERFPVAWNDIDLCQRVRRAGLRIVWTPHAVLTHLEGETRGIDAADPARQAAFEADHARYRALWGRAADTDPWLNPNLVATDDEICLGMPRIEAG